MSHIKIFVSAYACEPGLGSEIGVGWHWVLEMSKYFDLWVLTRESNRLRIESWIAKHDEYKNIHWLYYELPKWARFWKKGLRGVRLYYNLWQYFSESIVEKTMKDNNIHIFHHLTYGNALWKVSKYGQSQFFIWGPIGGLETIPKDFSKSYTFKWRIIETIRRMTIKLLPYNSDFQSRCENADLILCKTDITRNLIPEKSRHKAVLQTDVAVEKAKNIEIVNKDNKRLEIITVGRLDPWRGFDLCIESIALAIKEVSRIHLTIIGGGGDETRLKELVSRLGLNDYVTFTGNVSKEKYLEYISNCDIVLNASLKEGAVTVSFDSMAYGKPLICIDTTGFTRYFNSEYAVVVPMSDRNKLICDISNAILKLTNTELRKTMGIKAQEAGNSFSWESRGKEIYKIFTSKLIKP